jgi:hypothetical protein
MNIDLTDEETAALLRELDGIIASDRYFLSPAGADVEGDQKQDPAGASAKGATAAQALRAAAGRQPATRVRPEHARRPTGARRNGNRGEIQTGASSDARPRGFAVIGSSPIPPRWPVYTVPRLI